MYGTTKGVIKGDTVAHTGITNGVSCACGGLPKALSPKA